MIFSLVAVFASVYAPITCEHWTSKEQDGRVSWSSRWDVKDFLPDSHYELSAWMKADELGVVQFGVDSWNSAFKRHYYKQVRVPVTTEWKLRRIFIATPSVAEYPVFSNKVTRAVAKMGPKGFVLKDWKMRRLDPREVAEEHPTLEFIKVPRERCPAFLHNKVVNSSFELGMVAHGTYEEVPCESGARGKAEIDDKVAKHGTRSLRLDTRESSRPFSVKGAECWIKEGSDDCVYSVWLKADRPVKVRVSLADVSTDYTTGNASWKSTDKVFEVGTEWVRKSVAYGGSPKANRKYTPIVTLETPGILWMDAEQFESGNFVTDYAPAAEKEAAYVLHEQVFVQEADVKVPRTVELRTVKYGEGGPIVGIEQRSFVTDRFGKFSIDGQCAGYPIYPAEYTVLHALPMTATDPLDLATTGFYCGANGGPEVIAVNGEPRFKSVSGGTVADYIRMLRLFGVRMLRLHDSYPQWPQCAPERGRYDWRALDASVDACRAVGIEPMYVLGNYGLLAADDPKKDAWRDWYVRKNSKDTGYRKIWARHSVLPSDADWCDFIRALVTRYRGKMKYYEVVNEPNLQIVDAKVYSHLLELSSKTIRECDPEAIIVGVCATGDYGGDTGGFVKEVGEAGGFKDFDIMSFHPYNAPMDFSYPTAESLLAQVRKIAESYKPGCRLLEDEMYFCCDYTKNPLPHNRAWNWPARNYPRRLAIDAAGGCEGSAPLHVSRFWMGEPSHVGEGWAVWNAHYHCPSEVAVAGNAFAALLEGARFVGRPKLPEGYADADFLDRDGRTVRMVWAIDSSEGRLLSRPAGAEAFDLFGNRLPEGDVVVGEDPVYFRFSRPKVIFDTDMLTDFDDVGALACLHALADAGECEILATVSCTRGNASVGAIEVINGYYGRSGIPTGSPKGKSVMGSHAGAKVKVDASSPLGDGKTGPDRGHYKYRKLVHDYPQWVKHADADDAPDAVRTYRQALVGAPDGSVVICTVGFLTNLRALLESKGDDVSPLSGVELVSRKVRRWVAMACFYPQGKEYNSMWDVEASKYLFEHWPTPVVFSDWQLGADIFAGRAVAERKGPRNPVTDVFAGNIPSRREIDENPAHWQRECFGTGGRSAWDETAVLVAVRGPERYFNLHRGTFRMIGDDGTNDWSPDEIGGRHFRVTEKVDKNEVGRVIDELICRSPAGK